MTRVLRAVSTTSLVMTLRSLIRRTPSETLSGLHRRAPSASPPTPSQILRRRRSSYETPDLSLWLLQGSFRNRPDTDRTGPPRVGRAARLEGEMPAMKFSVQLSAGHRATGTLEVAGRCVAPVPQRAMSRLPHLWFCQPVVFPLGTAEQLAVVAGGQRHRTCVRPSATYPGHKQIMSRRASPCRAGGGLEAAG